jgi:pimeloyl-ACP methyl ester carboxylesterase
MTTVLLGEVKVAYDDEGGGQALTLIHGHPFNRSMWGPQQEHFSRSGCRVIAPDLRGYGDSTVVPGTTSLETFARDIVGLLDHLEIDRTIVGGLSMGGQIVMELARLFPQRIRGVLFADTSALPESKSGKRDRNEAADRLLREGMTGYAFEVLPKMMTPDNIKAQPEVARKVLEMMLTTSPEGAAAALRGRAERPDYRPTLRGLQVPALVVVGSDDEFTPINNAELIYDHIRGATLAVIDGAGHMPNLERPTEFNDALQQLLAQAQRRGATPT